MSIIIYVREVPYDKALLERYHKALDRAIQLATIHNIQPIPGTTVILCDLRPTMQQPCTSAKGLGKPRTVSNIITLRNSYSLAHRQETLNTFYLTDCLAYIELSISHLLVQQICFQMSQKMSHEPQNKSNSVFFRNLLV